MMKLLAISRIRKLLLFAAMLGIFAFTLSHSATFAQQSGVTITPGQNIQTVVNSYPAGTTFTIGAGVHRMQSIRPRNGDTYIGQPGAILNGSRLLTTFQREGNYWVVTGQTQEGMQRGECLAEYPRCTRPEDLFFDNQPLLHVSSLDQLRAGAWYFDYPADRIYIYDNPSGHTVETSVTSSAFFGTASNVTIRNLTVEKYANRAQTGAVEAGQTTAWTIDNVTMRYNHGAGVHTGNQTHLLNSRTLYNGQLGVDGNGNDVLVENTEIAFNNAAGFNSGWEAGGTKFSETNRLVVRNNYVHHNNGPGLWTDVSNINTLYEGNQVYYNQRHGIYHEISYDAIIRNNVVRYNGLNGDNWLWGAQIMIATSSNVEVYGNEVSVSAGIGNGIGVVNQNRGTGAYGTWRAYNNYVHDNIIIYEGTAGQSGVATDYNFEQFWRESNNRFDRNVYYMVGTYNTRWLWADRELNLPGVRTHGQEITGQLFDGLPDLGGPSFPAAEAPTLTSVPTNTATFTPSATPRPTNTATFTPSATPRPTNTATFTPSATPRPTNTATFTPSATLRPTNTATFTPSATLRPTNTATFTPSATLRPTNTATFTPSATPRPTNTPLPSAVPPAIARVALINADTEQEIGILTNGMTLNVAAAHNLNVRADTNPGTVGSVRFVLNGSSRMENIVPYAMWGDNNGSDYNAWTPQVGSYTLSVTAYTQANAAGQPSQTLTISFSVVNQAPATATPRPTNTPTPRPTSTPQAGAPSVTSFTLVNADTNRDIMTLNNGAAINLATLPTRNLNMRANTNPGTVGSVRFIFNGSSRLESGAPYALWGNNGSDYLAWTAQTGSYTVSATAYSRANAGGTASQTLNISFTVTNATQTGSTVSSVSSVEDSAPPSAALPAVASLTLINADTDRDIMTLTNGASLNLATLSSRNLNVRANTNPGTVGSVRFVLNGSSRTENGAPYAMWSDDDGNYANWTPQVGSYTLSVIAYAQTNAAGQASQTLTINFTVINQTQTAAAAPRPAATSTPRPANTPTPRPVSPPQASAPAITSLTLINADTDRDIMTLTNGAAINLSALPSRNLNVRANTNPGTVGSVRFSINGSSRTENGAPYAMWSDDGGNYANWTPQPGSYTLSVAAYTGTNAGGSAGQTMTINFTIVNGLPAATPRPPATATALPINTPLPLATATATPIVLQTAVPTLVLPSATPIPTIAATPTPFPLMLPASADMEDGALEWTATGNWQLVPMTGLSWQAGESLGTSILTWQTPINLATALNPRLTFQSSLAATQYVAGVEISLDGLSWSPLLIVQPSAGWAEAAVDLAAYRGQVIHLRWTWLPPALPVTPVTDSWLIDQVFIIDQPVLPTATPTELPTQTPLPTMTETPLPPTATPEPTATPTDVPTATPAPLDLVLTSVCAGNWTVSNVNGVVVNYTWSIDAGLTRSLPQPAVPGNNILLTPGTVGLPETVIIYYDLGDGRGELFQTAPSNTLACP